MLMKKIIFLLSIVLVFSSCGNQKTTISSSTNTDSKNEILSSAETDNFYDNYFKAIVESYNDQLEWSILMIDTESQIVLGQYGNTDTQFEPGNIVKPIIYASFIEYTDVDLESMIDNTPVVYGDNKYYPLDMEKSKSTVLESFKSLNNAAIVRLWETEQDNSLLLNSLRQYGIIANEEDLSHLFGYGISISLEKISEIYSDMIEGSKFNRQNTRNIINDILSHSFNNVTNFEANPDWTPYGVYETVAYPEKIGIDTNFVGYLMQDDKGIILAINVHDENDSFFTSKDLSEVVSNIFYSYISESYFTPLNDIHDIFKLNNAYIYWGRPTCLKCHVIENILFADTSYKDIYYFNTDLWRNHPAYKDMIDTYGIEKVPCMTYQNNGILKKIYFDSSEDELAYEEQIKAFLPTK